MTAFTVAIDQPVLDDLRDRLQRTRWPDQVTDDWSQGTQPAALRTLIAAWLEHDWRATETRLNALNHQLEDGLHFLRAGTPGKPPLLLVHGWPDSFLRFEELIPLLAGDFDLVVPSIPGYGFSARPTVPGTDPAVVADRFAELMTKLGFDRFAVHGGDLGTPIAWQLGTRHAARMTGIHLTNIPWQKPPWLSEAELSQVEQDFVGKVARWRSAEGAYAHEHGTKPQTLAAGLNDSPVGLASWFLEKFQAWTDRDVFDAVPLARQLDNLTLYWVTQTAGSAIRFYLESQRSTAQPMARVDVPTGVAVFPKDIVPAPREAGERFFDVRRWTELPRGGHFAAWEEPELLAADIIAFAREQLSR